MCADELREPPQNLNAERTVLGSMLIDYSTIDIVMDYLSAECFYPTAHQEIFKAVKELHEEHQPVDFISVSELLERNHKLEIVGGRSFLAELEQDVLTTQNADHYCALVKDAWQRRELIKASHNIIEDCYKSELDSEELIDRSEKRVFEITEETSGSDLKRYPQLPNGLTRNWKNGVKILMRLLEFAQISFILMK